MGILSGWQWIGLGLLDTHFKGVFFFFSSYVWRCICAPGLYLYRFVHFSLFFFNQPMISLFI